MGKKIAILGAGSWGLGLAHVLMDNGHEVLLWSRDEKFKEEFNEYHYTKKYFKNLNVMFNENVNVTNDINEAVNFSEYLVITLPSQAIRETLTSLEITEPKIFINGAKGIETETGKVISEIIDEVIDKQYIKGNVTISGPSHAEEVSQRMITTITISCEEEELANEIKELLTNDYFKLYYSKAQIEIQLAAALKNVIAIASGIVSGLGYGDNIKATLVTMGLAEIARFTQTEETKDNKVLFSLGGLGDLVVTAYSTNSRNYNFGYYLGQGYSVEEAKEKVAATIEGIITTGVLIEMADQKKIKMPVSEAIYNIIYEDAPIHETIESLLNEANLSTN